MPQDDLISRLSLAVKEGRIEESRALANEGLETGQDPLTVINGVTGALKEAGERFGRGDMFLTDLMFCAESAKAAMEVLTKEIKRQKREVPSLGRVLIGSVEGDIHDIGKSLVAAMLTAEGFEVIDIGVDVPDQTFVENVREIRPDILGMSALISSTMFKFRDVVEALKHEGLRENIKVIIGGAFIDQEWTDSSGADAYGSDAIDAVAKVKSLLKTK